MDKSSKYSKKGTCSQSERRVTSWLGMLANLHIANAGFGACFGCWICSVLVAWCMWCLWWCTLLLFSEVDVGRQLGYVYPLLHLWPGRVQMECRLATVCVCAGVRLAPSPIFKDLASETGPTTVGPALRPHEGKATGRRRRRVWVWVCGCVGG